MPQEDIGLRQYIAMLEKDEARLKVDLGEVRIAKAHAQRILVERGIDRAVLPSIGISIPENGTMPYAGLGNQAAALKFLKDTGRSAHTSEICDALKRGGIESRAKDFPTSIFGSLKRLVKMGDVDKVGRSQWIVKDGGSNPLV